jgi:hypothetical protein
MIKHTAPQRHRYTMLRTVSSISSTVVITRAAAS